ncbi:unnamed protein product [Cyprideis torosa]|uniref:Large ribosomal subunit protein uL3m n=1 Tax=Cyprideis torosa TaxID=163714 RepID=A0A7R8WPB3_9CRUS|nr:unnamed protein product [Cyprideis torosa]CAG0900523.1 unnamed protein product [Cyprideis torosa]
MGCQRRTLAGLKVWRINHKYNVLYVTGTAVPGEHGSFIYVHDCRIPNKRAKDMDNPPPFPTSYPEEGDEVPEDEFDPQIHQHDSPTITFPDDGMTHAAERVKKAKIAKKK